MSVNPEEFLDNTVDPAVRGFLHRPAAPSGNALVLTHGAGGNCKMPMLVAVSDALAEAGFTVLRCDLSFRQARPFGPPRPGDAARDRAGLKNAVGAVKGIARGRIFLGGQSYGGRQASMLSAEQPELVDGLVLLSYPLHPPGKPEQLRTQHLPKITVPVLFVEGTRDPFASIEEIQAALKLISGNTSLLVVDGVGHDLGFKGKTRNTDLPGKIVTEIRDFFASSSR